MFYNNNHLTKVVIFVEEGKVMAEKIVPSTWYITNSFIETKDKRNNNNVSYCFLPIMLNKGEHDDYLEDVIKSLKSSRRYIEVPDEMKYLFQYVVKNLCTEDDSIFTGKRVHHYALDKKEFDKYEITMGENGLGNLQFVAHGIEIYIFATRLAIVSVPVSVYNSEGNFDSVCVSDCLSELRKVEHFKVYFNRECKKDWKERLKEKLNGSLTYENDDDLKETSFLECIDYIIKDEKAAANKIEFDGKYFDFANEGKYRASFMTYFDEQNNDRLDYDLYRISRGHEIGEKFKDIDYISESSKEIEDNDRKTIIAKEHTVIGYKIYKDNNGNIEGGARAVNGYRNRYFSHFHHYYIFTYVVLLHQKYMYYHYLSEIRDAATNNLEILEKYQEELYDFNRIYSYPTISDVVNYQLFYTYTREIFEIDLLYASIHEPIDDLAELRRNLSDKKDTRRENLVNIILFALSFMTICSALIDGIDFIGSYYGIKFSNMKDSDVESFINYKKLEYVRYFWDVAIAVAIGVALYYVFINREQIKEFAYSIIRKIKNFLRKSSMKKCMQVKYIGLFIKINDVLLKAETRKEDRLDKIITVPHVTFTYKPDAIPWELFGKEAKVVIDGYGNDGKNEGFRVKCIKYDGKTVDVSSSKFDDGSVGELFAKTHENKVPHITISIAEGAQAKDTEGLKFEDIEEFELKAKFGGCLGGNRLIFSK